MKDQPIPDRNGMNGWKEIAIVPNDEKLISLENISQRIIIKPMYYLLGINGAINNVYVREGVVERLLRATTLLPKGYKFIVFDGWRPVEVQQSLYDSFREKLEQLHPTLDDASLEQLTTQFVSKPSVNPTCPSPHVTGGAIDLSIIDEFGNELDMGTHFDDFTEKSHTTYFEHHASSHQDYLVKENRRLLYHILCDVGFTNYDQEWWHFDYGNQFWAKQSNKDKAFYGVTSPRR